MSLRTALSIAIPAVGLLAVLAVPGELRSTRRPWLAKGQSRRLYVAVGFACLLVLAVVNAVV
jgi:hypothetical protein